MRSEWVKIRKRKQTEISVITKKIDIVYLIDIERSRCGKSERVLPRTSKYTNDNMQGTVSLQVAVVGNILM